MKTYYTLAVIHSLRWEPEFGSYDRDEVELEREGYNDAGYSTKILTTGDQQHEIDKAIAELNTEA